MNKKIIWVVVAVVILIAGGFVLTTSRHKDDDRIPYGDNKAPSDLKTYTNSKYGFEVKYPVSYDFNDKPGTNIGYDLGIYESAPFPTPLPRVVNFSAAKEDYINNSSFSIYADNSSSNLNYCLKDYNLKDVTRTKEINGNKFYVISDKMGDSAMGGARGQTSQYRLIHDNNCFIFDYVVYWHQVGYGGYVNTGVNDATPEQTKGQEAAIIRNAEILENILSSFKFTK